MLRKDHSSRIGDERILGGSSFVEQALKHDELKVDSKSHLKLEGWDLERLISHVCSRYSVGVTGLLSKARHRNTSVAKSVIC